MFKAKKSINQAYNSAQKIKIKLHDNREKMTIADISSKSGLSFNDVKIGLYYLLSEYSGNIFATSKGDLIYQFPNGFNDNLIKKNKLLKIFNKIKNKILHILKFLIRSWISIVLISYAIIFGVILLAFFLIKNNNKDDDNDTSLSGGILINILIRIVLDSLFWTMHPLFRFKTKIKNIKNKNQQNKKFHEKVNNFIFGQKEIKKDPLEIKKIIINEIRFKNGKIGFFDIVRITGLKKEKVNKLILQLMLEYNGDIKISKFGAIIYEFPDLRKTTKELNFSKYKPYWSEIKQTQPFTGNSIISNIVIFSINTFNIILSLVMIKNDLIINSFLSMLKSQEELSKLTVNFSNNEPISLILGWIPFLFSMLLFIFPVYRFLLRNNNINKNKLKNWRKIILRLILTNKIDKKIYEKDLITHFKSYMKRSPNEKELLNIIIDLEGKLKLNNNGDIFYVFDNLKYEESSLREEIKNAQNEEKNTGKIIFSSN